MSEQEQDYEIAETFVDGTELVPHPIHGAVPLYPDHPPDTFLPTWRCPHCGETGVTMKDVWRLYKRRERLLERQQDVAVNSDEYDEYQDGIRATVKEIDSLLYALDSRISGWIRKQVEPRFWDESDLNPENYD